MTYIDGFLVPVPADKKGAYLVVANMAVALYAEHRASRVVENWRADLADGKITDSTGTTPVMEVAGDAEAKRSFTMLGAGGDVTMRLGKTV